MTFCQAVGQSLPTRSPFQNLFWPGRFAIIKECYLCVQTIINISQDLLVFRLLPLWLAHDILFLGSSYSEAPFVEI